MIHQMQHFRTDITAMDDLEEPSESFDVPTEAMTTVEECLRIADEFGEGELPVKSFSQETE